MLHPYTVALSTLNCGFEDAFCGHHCVGVSHVYYYRQTVAIIIIMSQLVHVRSEFMFKKGKMISHKFHEESKKFVIFLEIH